MSLGRRCVAEFIGTGLLVATVVGSGIMADRLMNGNVGLALLANTIATGAALVALILAFGPISGAHLNPLVSLCDALEGGIRWHEMAAYIAAQLTGGLLGTAVAHLMFGQPLYSLSVHARHGSAQVFSEFVATFGLMTVIWGCSRTRSAAVPFAVGAYITAAYWFTASTSFANPAVTLARAVSNTFAGIRPMDAPAFIGAQLCGAVTATLLFRWLLPSLPTLAKNVVVPHERQRDSMKTYIFACVHNAGRSQMAAALFNTYAQPGCRAISAGTQPASRVHPEVVQVMREIGIDLSAVRPQKLTEELAHDAHVLVTMGCGDTCPYVPGLKIVDWQVTDPKGQPLDTVRAIRDDIHERVRQVMKLDCAECCSQPEIL